MWITLEQIQCLQAVSQHGSINSASDHLNKAKSAVSYSLNKLEEQLEFKVIDRSQYRIQLTPQGQAFLEKAGLLLEGMDDLKEEVHKIATGIEMKVSLSATAIYPSGPINTILSKLMKKFPDTEVTFHREILSGEKMLIDDTVDIGIFEGVRNDYGFIAKKIDEACLKTVISSNHPFLKLPKSQQTMDELKKLPNIVQRSTIPDDSDIGLWKDTRRWTVSDIDSKKDLILNNLGWGRLPDHFVAKELKQGKLVHLKHLMTDHNLSIYICRKKDKKLGPVLQYFWDSF